MLMDCIVACADCGHIADEHSRGGGFGSDCEIDGCGCNGYIPDELDYARILIDETASERLTLSEAEQIVGEPAARWVARCFEIATALADAVGGVAVYGCWDGPVAPGTVFSKNPSPNHGWVLLPDGNVFDPTRWVFEGILPYLYEGPADFYDEGRNRFRAERMGDLPVGSGEISSIELSDELAELLSTLCGTDVTAGLNPPQWMWVANLPYDMLDGHAAALYAALRGADMGAYIPWDNSVRAEREMAAR